MNRGVTLARSGDSWTVLVTPDVPLNEQRRNFRNLSLGDFDEIQLWSSGNGRVKRMRRSRSQTITTGSEVVETEGSEPAVESAPPPPPPPPVKSKAKPTKGGPKSETAKGKPWEK